MAKVLKCCGCGSLWESARSQTCRCPTEVLYEPGNPDGSVLKVRPIYLSLAPRLQQQQSLASKLANFLRMVADRVDGNDTLA
jgi:hypothetical protein